MKDYEDEYILTIVCTVYNHEKYLVKALEGFINQKCNFNYYIYILDDCSTDNSRKIIQEYKRKYNNIKTFYPKENIYQKGISPLFTLIEDVETKYIAICEGDDFWIDESKLQKQVDFLENNKDYSAVCHNVFVVDEYGNLNNDFQKLFPLYVSHEYTLEDLKSLCFCYSQTASFVICNFWKNLSSKDKKCILDCRANGDIILCTITLLYGRVWFMDDVMSCYRKSFCNDSWSSKIRNKNLSYFYIKSRKSLEKMVKMISDKNIKFDKLRYFLDALFILKSDFSKENLKIFFKCIKNIDIKMIESMIKRFSINKNKQKNSWEELSDYKIKKYIEMKKMRE